MSVLPLLTAFSSSRASAATLAQTVRPEYEVFDLGNFHPAALNNVGQVVGWSGFNAVLSNPADRNSSPPELRLLGQGKATGITDEGVIGGMDDRFGNNATRLAMVWVDGQPIQLQRRKIGGRNDIVNDISGSTVVGMYDFNFRWHAFSITGEDTDGNGTPDSFYKDEDKDGDNDLWQDLGTLGGYPTSALGIGGGQIVGSSITTNGQLHAFALGNGGLEDLGLLPNGDKSEAYDVSSDGTIVGHATTVLHNAKHTHAFRRGVFGMEDLDPNNSTRSTYANAVSAGGSPVVGKIDYGSPGSVRAFRWTPERGLEDLNNLLPAGTGWVLSSANDINDAGWIIGNGLLNGQGRAFLLVPKDPLPLIFVPGVSGSTLTIHEPGSDKNGFEIWLGLRGVFNREQLGLRPGDYPGRNVSATDVIRYAINTPFYKEPIYGPLLEALTTKGGYVEYNVAGLPARRTAAGCDLAGQALRRPNLFVFAYDWRLGNDENSARLKNYIDCVAKFYPGRKVNVLAHSMGGVLSRRYILDYPTDHNVNALITIGTPWLGAPKLFNALETGKFIDYIASGSGVKHAVESMTAGHQLMPSALYYQMGAPLYSLGRSGEIEPPYGEWGTDLDGDRIPFDLYDYPKMVKVIDTRYDTLPGTTSKLFHTLEQDDWRQDASGVKYFHLYSLQSQPRTIGQVLASNKPGQKDKLDWVTRFTPGDGTVPLISLARQGRDGLNLNAPNAQCFQFKSPGTYTDKAYDHVAFPNHPLAISKVFQLLYQSSLSTSTQTPELCKPPLIQQQFAAGAQVAQAAQTLDSGELSAPTIPQIDLTIYGADAVIVADGNGNSTAPIDGDLLGDVPGVDTYTQGPHSTRLLLSVGRPLTVTLQTTQGPLALDLLHVDGVTPTLGIHYQDVQLPAAVTAMLTFAANGTPSRLRYDGDGDGTFESEVTPSVTVTGQDALDVFAPTVEMTSTGPLAESQVTLSAADQGTGVAQIYFSLTGDNFQPYMAPLQLDLTQPTVLYAFADDRAGNRSPLATFVLSGESSTPTPTDTATPTITNTPTDTATNTPTWTPTPTDTATNTPTWTPTPTDTATNTPTWTPTDTATPTYTPTRVPSAIPFPFSGFLSPVDNPPVFNNVNAGQSIPVKFSLGGDRGLNILAAGYPTSRQVTCATTAPVDDIEQTTTSSSGLTYDAASGRYTYVWKAQKSWANTCREFALRLTDGSDHLALFKFK
jgi:probable HAF family extracellular repeat protein